MITRNWKTDSIYLMLIVPALTLFTLFFTVPFFRSLFDSFTDHYGYNPVKHLIGFDNYIAAFHDENFLTTLVVTFKYTAFVMLLGNVFALGLALIADSRIKGSKVLRSIFFLPNLMSLIIVGFVWTFLYGSVYQSFVELMGSPDFLQISWLGDMKKAIFSIGITAIWQSAGYLMIIYIAGLQNISNDVLEAARIDGADSSQILLRIKLPLLSPVIVMNLILSATASLKGFDFPLAMTSGGPAGSTTTIAYYIYTLGFKAQRTGYATAVSMLLFLIIALITLILTKLMQKREEKLSL